MLTYCVDDSVHNHEPSVIYSSPYESSFCGTKDRNSHRCLQQFPAMFSSRRVIARMSMHTPPPSSPIRFRMTRGLSKRFLIESSAKPRFHRARVTPNFKSIFRIRLAAAEATHTARAQQRVRFSSRARVVTYLPTLPRGVLEGANGTSITTRSLMAGIY